MGSVEKLLQSVIDVCSNVRKITVVHVSYLPSLVKLCTHEFKRDHETMYRVQVAQDPPKPSDHQTTTLLLPLSLVNFILLLFQMGHKSRTYVWKKKKVKKFYL